MREAGRHETSRRRHLSARRHERRERREGTRFERHEGGGVPMSRAQSDAEKNKPWAVSHQFHRPLVVYDGWKSVALRACLFAD